MAIPYGEPWAFAKFKWTNNQCQGQRCSPRCVNIQRKGEISGQNTQEYLIYDCELGFYEKQRRQAISTAGSTYSLDIWNIGK